VLRDLHVLIILQVDSPLPMRYSVALGSQFPILETSSGAVLLANLPVRDRAALIERIAASGDLNGEDLAARLAGIDTVGFEMRPSLAVDGCINISLPIRDHTDTTVAALTVPYLPQKHARFDRKTVFVAAQAAALEISRGLGAAEDVLSGSAANRR
jgi:DNA-binding IclR family transcriptional regulator